jgi:hypothetical protein
MVLWVSFFGAMMVLPGISDAQMQIDVSSIVSVKNGLVKLESDFRDRFTGMSAREDVQTQYLARVVAFGGGPTTVGSEFQTNSKSEIAFAGLTILKDGSKNLQAATSGALQTLRALEKIGTAYMRGNESFGVAGGSEI